MQILDRRFKVICKYDGDFKGLFGTMKIFNDHIRMQFILCKWPESILKKDSTIKFCIVTLHINMEVTVSKAILMTELNEELKLLLLKLS